MLGSGFFGRVLSVRLEFGYWVFEGDEIAAQRPSWNYRADAGGGIVLDMFPHWQYLLTDLFGPISAVYARTATHIPRRWDESGTPYEATADDAAYAVLEFASGAFASVNSSWAVRVNRRELLELQVDGTAGSAVSGLRDCAVQHRVSTPMPVWNPDLPDPIDYQALWSDVPDNMTFDNGFKVEWEQFLTLRLRGAAVRLGPGRGGQGGAAGQPGAAVFGRGPAAIRTPAGGLTCRADQLPGRDGPLVIPSPAGRRVPAAAPQGLRGRARGRRLGTAAPVIDWESTMRFREHLWAHGFGVAEAMDTAQRGMGLSWEQARELIARTAARAAATGGSARWPAGRGPTSSPTATDHPLGAIIDAYAEQVTFVQSAGAQVILMASRALAATARGPRDYLEVYGELLKQADRPVILHWLGEAFDPALRGYWGGSGFDAAAATVLELIDRAGGQVDGVKLSVLDAAQEVSLRRRLPAGVRLYTGDDFNYASLIRGDADGSHSDALLGAFAAITAPAAAALAALDGGDLAGYDAAMEPTVPLSRLIFEPPTYHYKAGVAFLAWLNGLQPQFVMLGGLERQRPAGHLIRLLELAAAAGALSKPELAVERMGEMLARSANPVRP